jgi:preprotein translocase subunit SecE
MSAMDQMREFYKDVRVEFTKISWPTRDELKDSTIVVIISVLLVAAFIGLVDQLLNTSVGVIFR